MTTKVEHRAIAVLKLPRPVPILLSVARAIVIAMTGNPAFSSPVPNLALVSAAVGDLELAEAAAQMRTKGTVAARDRKVAVLVAVLQQLRGYVQNVVDGDPDHGPAIIESGAMYVKRVGVRPARVFAARQGPTSGSVTLVTAAAARRAAYEWEFSADSGATWQALPPTLRSETRMSGLRPATTYLFRFRAITRAGPKDWSSPVALLVH